MIAAAHVNLHYLLILLLPLVAACVALALTWYSRVKRRRENEAKRLARGTPGGRRSAAGSKSRSGGGANGRSATGTRPRSAKGAKRRR